MTLLTVLIAVYFVIFTLPGPGIHIRGLKHPFGSEAIIAGNGRHLAAVFGTKIIIDNV
jgi:hypothetical protein